VPVVVTHVTLVMAVRGVAQQAEIVLAVQAVLALLVKATTVEAA
jgi:hypothetical protein